MRAQPDCQHTRHMTKYRPTYFLIPLRSSILFLTSLTIFWIIDSIRSQKLWVKCTHGGKLPINVVPGEQIRPDYTDASNMELPVMLRILLRIVQGTCTQRIDSTIRNCQILVPHTNRALSNVKLCRKDQCNFLLMWGEKLISE